MELNTKKRIIIGLLVLLLLVPTFFISSWGWGYMRANQAVNNFAKIVEQGDLSDLSLTIYHTNPNTLGPMVPWSVDSFRRSHNEQKIVVSGSELEEHIDLFKQISSDDLVPTAVPVAIELLEWIRSDGLLVAVSDMWGVLSSSDVLMYYVFECRENGKLFDVVMWGYGGIIVNGFAVEDRRIFYEIIIPFLPEYAAESWGELMDRFHPKMQLDNGGN